MKSILGNKIGMTQIFTEEGKVIPVSLIDVSDVKVSKVLAEGQIELGKGSKRNPNKPDLGNYKELGFVPKFKFVINTTNELKVGDEIKPDVFATGDKVDVIGTTKGKGFQGVVKRYGFKGGPETHGGHSGKLRSPGSIGSGTTPGRVLKGKKMPGRMGNERQTIQNLKIALVDLENNIIGVTGSIPGANGTSVVIKQVKYA